jgi:hypothetical protein
MSIDLKPGTPYGINCKVYPLTEQGKITTLQFLKEYEDKGYIEKTSSQYSSPWFLIPKKDGSSCPVQDHQKVNEWTILDTYLLP